MKSHRAALTSLASHSIGNVAYRLSALFLISVCASTLGPEALGVLEQFLALSLLAIPLVSFHASESFLSVLRGRPDSAAQSAAMIILLASVVVICLGGGAIILDVHESRVVAAFSAYVVTTMAWQFIRNVVRVEQRYIVLTASELSQSCAMLFSGFCLLRLGVGFSSAAIAIAIGNAVACFISVYGGKVVELINPTKSTLAGVKDVIGASSKILPNVVLWWAIELSDRLILANYVGDRDVGIYSAGARMAGIGMAACLLMYQSWQVLAIRALSAEDRKKEFFQTTLAWYGAGVSLVFSLLLCLLTPLRSLLFGDRFDDSSSYAAALVPGLHLSAMCYFFGIVLFSPGRAASFWKASTIGFSLSVAINIALIPIFGAYVAAIASFSAYAAILFVRCREAEAVLGARLNAVNFYLPFLVVVIQAILVQSGAPVFVLLICFAVLIFISRAQVVPFVRSVGLVINKWVGSRNV